VNAVVRRAVAAVATEWFLAGMIAVVAVASVAPHVGRSGGLLRLDAVADWGVVAVFFLHGVGLSVVCTPTTLASLRVGDEARLSTSLVVREDSLTLYGFADDDARGLFELLQTASGVGPRLAQAMLAVHSPDALRRAIAAADEKALTQVPGIGRKGAQRLILERLAHINYLDTYQLG